MKAFHEAIKSYKLLKPLGYYFCWNNLLKEYDFIAPEFEIPGYCEKLI